MMYNYLYHKGCFLFFNDLHFDMWLGGYMLRVKILRKIVVCATAIGIFFVGGVLTVNFYVKKTSSNRIIKSDKALDMGDFDCILVLGAGIRKDNSPSSMLNDRLVTGIELYKIGAAPKILMSGDHGRSDYDEVNVMKKFAVENGVPSENVFMDHAGFSTYESIYRAKEIFKVKKMLIVTQEYHLYRALFIAEKLGIESYGVNCSSRKYGGDTYRNLREILARNKDFFVSLIKPEPEYLGDIIPISGDGNATNDSESIV